MSTLSDRSVQGNTFEDVLSLGKYVWTSGQGTLLLGTYSLHTLLSLIILMISLVVLSFTLSIMKGTDAIIPGNPIFFSQIFFSKISPGSDTSQVSYLEVPAVTLDPGTFLIQC